MIWLSLTVLMIAGAGPGGRPHARRSGADTLTMSYDVSGLHVIQRVNRATDIVAVRLYFLGGTRQITDATAGVEALWLEATGYGSARYPEEQAQRAMARTGGVVQIEWDADWSVLGFTGLAQDFDAAWDVLADRVMNASLTDPAIGQARARLVSRAHTRYTDPDERIQIIASRSMFPDHPYSLDPGGTETSLNGITPEQVRTYARDQLVTSRLLLVIVGNVERAHAESLVAATLGKLSRGTYRWTLPPPPPNIPSRWLVEHREIPTNYILCYFTGPPPTERMYWAFRVATAFLSSQIQYTVRMQRSLSYAAYAQFIDRAVPIGGAYASTPKPDQVLPLMQQAVRDLQAAEIEYFDLHRFLDSYVFEYLEANATAADQADFLARAELYLGDFRRGDDFMKRLQRVSSTDIRDAAHLYMSKLQYAYLGDTTRMRGHW
jgi:zinc protease